MTGGVAAWRTEWHTGLNAVDRVEWDRLLGSDGFYGSYSWLRAIRRHETFSTRYLTIRNGSGSLLAATALGVAQGPPEQERQFDPAALFQEVPATLGLFYPAAVVGVRTGYSTVFPFDTSLPLPLGERLMADLIGACAEEGRLRGARSLSWLYLPPAMLERMTPALPETAAPVLTGIDAVLPVRWTGFDEYLAGFSGHRRYGIRRDLMAVERAGCTITRGSLEEHVEDLVPLLVAVQRRYGALDSVPLIRERLAEQAESVGRDALCLLCHSRGGALAGFSLFYQWRNELYARVVGFDYDQLPENPRAYFSLLFYEPVRYAIEHGITSIRYGLETGLAKVGRGAVLEPRWSVTIGPADAATVHACRRHNVTSRRRILDRFGAFPQALPDASWSLDSWRRFAAVPDQPLR